VERTAVRRPLCPRHGRLGALISLSGFAYDGPAGRLGFAPTYGPADFKSFFAAAEGGGSLVQRCDDNAQTNRIKLKWGKLTLKTLDLRLPENKTAAEAVVTISARKVKAELNQDGRDVTLIFAQPITIARDESLQATLKW
jgi:hypothetical protein